MKRFYRIGLKGHQEAYQKKKSEDEPDGRESSERKKIAGTIGGFNRKQPIKETRKYGRDGDLLGVHWGRDKRWNETM